MEKKSKKISRREFLNWFSTKAPATTIAARSFFSFATVSAFVKKAWAQYVPHGNWKNRTHVGSIWTWGLNTNGNIGNGTTTSSSSPVHIGALEKYSDVAISEDGEHSIAVRDDGSLWTWGRNNLGQLGNNVSVHRSSPAQVGALTNWSKVFAARSRCFAIKTDGTLWAWGGNTLGYLGDNSITQRTSPIQIGADTNWSNIAAGGNHTLALRSNGTLWSWGENGAGQLGDGSGLGRSSPVQVGAGTDWAKIAATGNASMAIKTDGTLWFWGRETNLRPQNYWVPNQVGALTDWSKVSTTNSRSVAIKSDGTMWSWGAGFSGVMGLGPSVDLAYSPTQIGTDTDWSKIFLTPNNGYAIKSTGSLWAWGVNTFGTVGDNSTTARSAPVQVGVATNWVDVTAHSGASLAHAVKSDGTLWAWGELNTPVAGVININQRVSSPVQIGTDTNWSKICSGRSHTVAIKSTGTMWSWGVNDFGQLGQNLSFTLPAQKTATNDWAQVCCSNAYVMAIKTDGTLWAWGLGQYGQLGLGATVSTYSPIQVGAATWSKVVTGDIFTMGIQTNGSMWAIGGLNSSGQLGNPAFGGVGRSTPIQLGTDTDWTDVAAGYFHVLGVRSGQLWAWGTQTTGVLGLGDTTPRSSPVQVGSLTNWSKVAAFYASNTQSSAALKTNGTIWAWGSNSVGQLGDSTTVSKSSPIQVGTDTNWSKLSAGNERFHAIKTTGTLWGWGAASQRVLGISTGNVSSPIQIGADTDWAQVYGGPINMCAIKSTGTLWMCGAAGALVGQGNAAYSSADYVLTQVGTDTNWASASVGSTVYAIKTNNQLWGWGNNNQGQLLIDQGTPSQIGSDSDWASVSGLNDHNLAVKTGGTLWGWGYNSNGQLGANGTYGSRAFSPMQIGAATDWTKVSANSGRSMGLRGTGLLFSWGNSNAFGQLGDNTNGQTAKSSPIQVGAATDWIEISAGSEHSLGIRTGNTLWAWGYNGHGQLGLFNGSPVQIGSATDWAEIALGGSNEFAVGIKTGGSIWAWGTNDLGQLGLNDTTARTSPVQIGALTNWAQISAGGKYAVAIKTDGSLWSWGAGANGKLASGTTANRSSPVQVGVFTGWTKVSAGADSAIAKK